MPRCSVRSVGYANLHSHANTDTAVWRCQALFDVFQSKFEQGAPAQELLRLATEQDAAVARVPADFRRYFSHLRVALSACNDIRLEALLCQAAELVRAALCVIHSVVCVACFVG